MNAPFRTDGLQADAEEHEDIRRMPALLGRASGPRNMPRSHAHLTYVGDSIEVTVRALTDAAALSQYLPPRCRLAGEPVIAVAVNQLTNLGWLAGRGYNIVNVSTQIVFEGDEDKVQGRFIFCLWENKADPVLTGREELGMPKLFADIANPREIDGRWECSAVWEGFKFLDLRLDTTDGDENAPIQGGYASRGVTLVHRYHQRTGEWGQADIDQIVISHPSDSPPPRALHQKTGVGKFAFHPARWEDMPTQYTFINALAGLPLLEFRGGQYVKTKGIGNLKAFRIAK
jgi:hypothetical protein